MGYEDPSVVTSDILKIQQFRTGARDRSLLWASNLRFLSVPSSDDARKTKSPSPQPGKPGSCRCAEFPSFAALESDRILELSTVPGCQHYAAVSYCWQSSMSSDEECEEAPYLIKTGNGLRKSRAPTRILKRAISYAATYNISLIWIDQESIIQDDPVDKEVGIQSMDLVYERAGHPIALWETVLDRPEDIQIFGLLHKRCGEKVETMNDPECWDIMNNILGCNTHDSEFLEALSRCQHPDVLRKKEELLEMHERHCQYMKFYRLEYMKGVEPFIIQLAEDRWLTRCWISQEACSAGQKMNLLLFIDRRVRHDDPAASILYPSQTDLTISFETMFLTLQATRSRMKVAIRESVERNNEKPLGADERLWSALDTLTPALNVDGRSVRWTESRRFMYHAAEAVDNLHTRQNERISDRIAIIANLCDYEVRLDTYALESGNYPFSSCILALSVLNGDFSLLSTYSQMLAMQSESGKDFPLTKYTDGRSKERAFSWVQCLSGLSVFLEVNRRYRRRFGMPRARTKQRRPTLSQEGLRVRGYLWEVFELIDLRSVCQQIVSEWEKSLPKSKTRDLQLVEDDSFTRNLLWAVLRELASTNRYDVADIIWRWEKPRQGELNRILLPVEKFADVIDPVGHKFHLRLPSKEIDESTIIKELGSKPDIWSVPHWLVDHIMKTGYLAVARATEGSPDCETCLGLFAADLSDTIFTYPNLEMLNIVPHVTKEEPHSWVMASRGKTADGTADMYTTGGKMICGYWNFRRPPLASEVVLA